jgi:hypothetical protein
MDLYHELRSLLDQVRTRWTWRVGLRTVARMAGGGAIPLAAAALADYLLRPQGIPLLVLAAVSIALAVVIAGLAAWQMPRRPSDGQVARFIEERAVTLCASGLNDSLVSAIDAAERATDQAAVVFLPLMLRDAIARVRTLPPEEILPRAEVARYARLALGATALLLAVLVATVPFLGRASTTARVRLFPESIRVEVSPGDIRVPAGTSLRIRASLHGPHGALTRVAPELHVSANAARRTVAMSPAGDGFDFTIASVDRSFSYVVSAGSAQSKSYTVTALTAPRVERIDLHYEYPSFSGLGPRDEQDGGDVYAPAGTRVRLNIHTDRPIAHGELALGRSPAISLRAVAGARTVEAELTLAKDDSYRVRLVDGDGLNSSGETEYFIRLMDDRPPDVRILRPSADQQITPLEEVPIEARADDDYGIGRFELVYSVAGGPERVVPFERVTGTTVQKIGTRLLTAEDLGVKPGDVITYYARARDVARGKRSTEATSDIFFLEVKPFTSEFVAAQSQGGGGGGDPQIESLIQAQKEIISSTWNVERRSQGGRSQDDVKAIAAAQAALKSRAEEQLMSRTSRSRARPPAPQRQAFGAPQTRGSAGDPVANAVDAMARALHQLEGERTKEALAHEMAALNGLLQAQAEVRRRQVTQQTNGAGNGWGNRNEQDLSALFDKELQRQQRTNYETRPSVETQPDREKSDDVLDRIRELARRQEDLSRRQAELAKADLGAEEMKRQLERLTREQTQLREQAEEILRRNGEPGAAGRGRGEQRGEGGRGAGTNQEQDALRRATDQMRSAASDLRRDDPARAAANGQRAAEQLRRLAEQGGGRRAGGSTGPDVPSPEARQLTQQLAETRAIRDRLQRAEQQLRSAEAAERGASGGRDSTARREGQAVQPGREGHGAGGRATDAAGRQGNAGGGGAGDVQRLRDEYQRELQRAQQALERLNSGQPRSGANGSTPEEQEFSRSAPGTEAFKQDRGAWESLRKGVDSALEKYEASVSDRLARTRRDDRFNAGGSDRVPDAYRQMIAKYFESLAKKKS